MRLESFENGFYVCSYVGVWTVLCVCLYHYVDFLICFCRVFVYWLCATCGFMCAGLSECVLFCVGLFCEDVFLCGYIFVWVYLCARSYECVRFFVLVYICVGLFVCGSICLVGSGLALGSYRPNCDFQNIHIFCWKDIMSILLYCYYLFIYLLLFFFWNKYWLPRLSYELTMTVLKVVWMLLKQRTRLINY